MGEDACPPVNFSPKIVFTCEGENDTEADAIQKATVYVFDKDNNYVKLWSMDNPRFDCEYIMNIDLPAGLYNFVVWFNQNPPYFSMPAFDKTPEVKSGKKDAELSLQIPPDRIINYALPPLFHGSSNEKEIKKKDQVITIPLTRNTNNIILTVNGLERTNDVFSFNITDNNGCYDFDNNFVPCTEFHYNATATFPAGSSTLAASMTILKLADNRSPRLTFSNRTTGENLFPSYNGQENNLIKMIQQAYNGKQLDFNSKHTFRITITFTVDMKASVTVDGWKIDESDYGVGPD
jgi:hypothetical protein